MAVFPHQSEPRQVNATVLVVLLMAVSSVPGQCRSPNICSAGCEHSLTRLSVSLAAAIFRVGVIITAAACPAVAAGRTIIVVSVSVSSSPLSLPLVNRRGFCDLLVIPVFAALCINGFRQCEAQRLHDLEIGRHRVEAFRFALKGWRGIGSRSYRSWQSSRGRRALPSASRLGFDKILPTVGLAPQGLL